MLCVLHGASALKIFVILSINYVLARAGGGRKWAVLATWVFNGGILFLNEWYHGYTFYALLPSLATLVCALRLSERQKRARLNLALVRIAGKASIHVGTSASI